MKVEREGKSPVIIGKRIPIGAVVGGLVSFGVWMWNAKNPETQIPAEQAVGLSTIAVGIAQILVVNRLGVTQ